MGTIDNEVQLRHARSEAAKFERAIAAYDDNPKAHPGVSPRLVRAQREAMESQLATIRRQVAEYEALRGGGGRAEELDALERVPDALIRARIAAGLTQRQLAERLGMREQQIQRYEATRYASASLTRLIEVARALADAN